MQSLAGIFRRFYRPSAKSIAPTTQFNLLRLFSCASFILISLIALILGSMCSRFLVAESLERDALMSAQFIQTIAKRELRQNGQAGTLTGATPSSPISKVQPKDNQQTVRILSEDLLDYLSHLPDSLLITIYSPARTIIWSTNSQLIGTNVLNNELERAFNIKDRVSTEYNTVDESRTEQKFSHEPRMFFVESYIPITGDGDHISAVIEIYREPLDLAQSLQRGHWLIWLFTMGGMIFYLGLCGIARRASTVLASHEDQIVANKTYVGLIEMSTAVAHSLRNPLASIRSSAELAIEIEQQTAKRYINDIVSQVDRMSSWIDDLLLYLSPIQGGRERVEPTSIIQATLESFGQQLILSRVQVTFDNKPACKIISSRILISQIINSVIANSIEAMPTGGKLVIQLSLDKAHKLLHLTITDSGNGLWRQQQMLAYKSFYTTRQGRLGIGLAMTKQIMRSLSGEASFSFHEKNGTTVHLTFRDLE